MILQPIASDTLQLVAWFLAAVELCLAVYVLLLGPRHTANRHAAILLLSVAANSLGLALTLNTGTLVRAGLAIRAAALPASQPLLLLVTAAMLRPDWLPGRGRGGWRHVGWLVYALGGLPIALTLVDVVLGTRLWFTPPATVSPGSLEPVVSLVTGTVARPIQMPITATLGLATLGLLLYVLVRDRKASVTTRRVAGLVLGTAGEIITIAAMGLLLAVAGEVLSTLITGGLCVALLTYLAFTRGIGRRRPGESRLQTRLTAVVLALVVPMFIVILTIVNLRASTVLEDRTEEQLAAMNQGLSASVTIWLDLNIQALTELVSLPDIVSMDPSRQKPILRAMAAAHPHMYLVSTTDLKGMNVARNDEESPKDYGDRTWLQAAANGEQVAFQTLIGRTSGQPALVASMPIRDEAGRIVGVGMFAADLTDIANQVQTSRVGDSGYAYVVNSANQVIAHPNPSWTAELRDLSDDPPVAALRQGTRGRLSFVDTQGERWRAHIALLDRDWGVIVQEPEKELLAELRARQSVSWALVGGGALLLMVLTWLLIGQALGPIKTLTDTAAAIAGGDLTRTAHVESRDEIGRLARAFNAMTDQLRTLIGSLEQRVADRVADIQRGSHYLRSSSEVGRAVTSILDAEALSHEVVELIREEFGLYYVGLFLVEESGASSEHGEGPWAVLRAGTGQAGVAMLARGHRILVGHGMVGWSIAHAEARVALEAEADTVRMTIPELPNTRSEAALPLRSRGRVLGALTVQSTQHDAFDADALVVLQTMADQVAVALDNARLYTAGQEALEAARRAYGEMSRQAWLALLVSHGGQAEWGYRFTADETVVAAEGAWRADMLRAVQTGQVVELNGDQAILSLPLKVRGQVVGVVSCRKTEGQAGVKAWSADERTLLATLLDQVSAALESARLFEDTQRRAARERLTAEITARMRETLNIDTVLQAAVREIGDKLDIAEVEVRMRNRGEGA